MKITDVKNYKTQKQQENQAIILCRVENLKYAGGKYYLHAGIYTYNIYTHTYTYVRSWIFTYLQTYLSTRAAIKNEILKRSRMRRQNTYLDG